MQVTTNHGKDAVRAAARIWADATAHRDEARAGSAEYAEAERLLGEALAGDRSLLITADEDDALMAFAAVRADDAAGVAELRYMGVTTEHWGEGWARRLLIGLPAALREAGFDQAYLWVYADNIRAVFLYEAMGWAATAESRHHVRTGRVEQKYRLSLR